ncbi:MAG TPA: hypothetical protein VKA54_01460 [Gemmatimonadaceae bacterium]|nr:hypothetical protein [Gemmatimonadaceae bacterium]
MFGSKMLEVAIGIIFVFLLVSLICSAIREGIESWVKARAAFLEQGIRELLHDKSAVGIARSVYTHPLIFGLYLDEYRPRTDARLDALSPGGNLPSYIPSRSFALALMDIAARGIDTHGEASGPSAPELTLARMRENVLNIENGAVQRVLLGAIDTAGGSMERAVANVAAWYDSGMDRVSGAYKRATQKILLGIGLAVAVGMNVNTIAIGRFLFRHDAERAVLVAAAETAARDSSILQGDRDARYARAIAALDSLRLPIGWDDVVLVRPWTTRQAVNVFGARTTVVEGSGLWLHVFEPLVGWLVTALAVMLGAPFWFDILNKVMVIRSTVKPHEKSPEESSEDRQTGKDRTSTAGARSGSTMLAEETRDVTPARSARSEAPPAPTRERTPVAAPDPDNAVDACDVQADVHALTSDEDLPAAQGGIA